MLANHVKRFRLLLGLAVLALFACALTLRLRDGPFGRGATPPTVKVKSRPMVSKWPFELVMAKMKREDTSWVQRHLPDWHANIYHVDDDGDDAELKIPANKGHEAMTYLTYLIDRYDSLPDVSVFMHAQRFQWHNDHPDYDSLWSLQNLNFSYIQTEGYANLRCVWVLGCPGQSAPYEMVTPQSTVDDDGTSIFENALRVLFPNIEVPEVVGVNCCSQFAVSREAILQRPREEYVQFRSWLIDTELEDKYSGRVFEYSWHSKPNNIYYSVVPSWWPVLTNVQVIFGKRAMHCPSASDCYCRLYGLCNMTCSETACEGRYTLPPYSTLPQGWPRIGWEGEQRDFAGPL